LITYVQNDALWAATFDGAPPRQISPDGLFPLPTDLIPYEPASVSPDGHWVLAVPSKDDQGTWLLSTDGTTQRQINKNRVAVSWAPNSQGYAWVDDEGLYTSSLAEGAAPFTVTKVDSSSKMLSLAVNWAYSGDQIAFQVQTGNETSLRLVSAAGGAVRTLATATEVATEYGQDAIVWSPDGRALLWTLPRPPRIVYTDNRPEQPFANELVRAYGFSPDSQRLLLAWGADAGVQLVTSDLAVANRQVLDTNKGDYAYAAWSPDGRQVAFIRFPEGGPGAPADNQVWVVGSDGQGARRLAAGAGTTLAPFSAEWLAPTALVVGSGDQPPEITLFRLDTTSDGIQPLIRNIGWFFAVPRR
jgi:Tol biopolymer transport system component